MPKIIELTEYQTRSLAENELSEQQAMVLHSNFGKHVSIEPPSFLNNKQWQLTSQGWVGYIPLSDTLHFSLTPKVPIKNIFRMLEYAYRLDFKILEGLTNSESIADLFERLALILSKRILDRIRKGLYRSYVPDHENLPYVRGRIDMVSHIRMPQRVNLPCHFEEHTPDLEENQILLWTLTKILESGICTERALPTIRQARRALLGFSTLIPFSAQSCVNRLYNRLNHDYEPLHALCRFFLENIGPTHSLGDRRMLPILVNMERLFELFVVEWLKEFIPSRYIVRGQEKVQLKMGYIVSINIDITITDITMGNIVYVLDTKYKAPKNPSASDIEQVVAYAEAKGSKDAVLIYPIDLEAPLKGMWGSNIKVQSTTFGLNDDLDEAGRRLIRRLALIDNKAQFETMALS